jgi:hypothetical protein
MSRFTDHEQGQFVLGQDECLNITLIDERMSEWIVSLDTVISHLLLCNKLSPQTW